MQIDWNLIPPNNTLETLSFLKENSFKQTYIDFPDNHIARVISLTENITVRMIIAVETTSVL